MNFAPNERADELAKEAAKGATSDHILLPPFLRKKLPLSVSAIRQAHTDHLRKRWARSWKTSPRFTLLKSIDNSPPSRKFLKITRTLTRRQASVLVQLRTGHSALNQHLFRIHCSESPCCSYCGNLVPETVKHFLLECPLFDHQRHYLARKLKRKATSLAYLLNDPKGIPPLLKFIHYIGRFKAMYGSLAETR